MVNLWGPGAFGAARPAAVRPTLMPANGALDADDWSKDCTSPTARDGTEWRAGLLNALIANMRSVVRKSGVAVTNLDDDLLMRAIRKQGINYFPTVGGTANALTLALNPTITSYSEIVGTPLRILVPAVNTSTGPTLNVDGLGAVTIKRLDGSGLAPGELLGLNEVIFDGTDFRAICLRSTAENTLKTFTASGTYTRTPGRTAALVFNTAAGGSGGGGTGGGGGAGETAISLIALAGLAPQAVNIGAGGVAPAVSTPGNDGGDTTFGSLMTAKGGKGGLTNGGGSYSVGGLGGTGGTGQLLLPGSAGGFGSNSGAAGAGVGGPSFWGGAARGGFPTIVTPQDGQRGGGGGGGWTGGGGKGGDGVTLALEL